MSRQIGHSTIGEAMRSDIEAAHIEGINLVAAVADDAGCSPDSVYKWTEGSRSMKLSHFVSWCRTSSADNAARWFIRKLGYIPVRAREEKYTVRDVEMTSLPDVMTAMGTTVAATAEALKDGKFDDEEIHDIHRKCLTAGVAIEQLRYDCEAAMTDSRVTSLAEAQRKGASNA